MKTIFIPVFIITVILMISGIVIFQSENMENTDLNVISEVIHVSTIVILLITGIYFGRKRLKQEKEKLAKDDELSQMILYKTGYFTFYLCMFLWLILLYVETHSLLNPQLIFSYGFIGTALIFIVTLSIFNKIGLKNG